MTEEDNITFKDFTYLCHQSPSQRLCIPGSREVRRMKNIYSWLRQNTDVCFVKKLDGWVKTKTEEFSKRKSPKVSIRWPYGDIIEEPAKLDEEYKSVKDAQVAVRQHHLIKEGKPGKRKYGNRKIYRIFNTVKVRKRANPPFPPTIKMDLLVEDSVHAFDLEGKYEGTWNLRGEYTC